MNLKQYLQKYKKDRQKLSDLADTVGVQRIYLTQIAWGGGRKYRPSAGLARRLHQATQGEIHMSELRPDIFPPGESITSPPISLFS